ncbi:hypothetical protein Gotur_007935 [Gossypium turneri]
MLQNPILLHHHPTPSFPFIRRFHLLSEFGLQNGFNTGEDDAVVHSHDGPHLICCCHCYPSRSYSQTFQSRLVLLISYSLGRKILGYYDPPSTYGPPSGGGGNPCC